MSKKAEDPTSETKPKRGKKKLFIFLVLGVLLIGGGVGAGYYASGMGAAHAEKAEDPRRPQLVLRSEHAEAAAEGGHGDEKTVPRRTGTVPVAKEGLPIDSHKYEIAYYPLEQSFTANLADGSGFVQLSISLATYFDSRVTDNVERQMVPIRSAVLMVLSDQHAAVLSTLEGKQRLQRLLTKTINETLRKNEGFGGIDDVYFTSMVLQ